MLNTCDRCEGCERHHWWLRIITIIITLNTVNWLIDFVTEATDTITQRPMLRFPTYVLYVAVIAYAAATAAMKQPRRRP